MKTSIQDRLLERLNFLYENISSDVSRLEITAYLTREPKKFAERKSGKTLRLKEGDGWGERLFDCAWMKFEGEMPAGETENIAVKIDVNGEMFIAGNSGSPVCGLTCKASKFTQSLGKPAKCLYILPKSFYGKKKFSLWADCGLNDLFGRLKGEGRIACARVVKINPQVRELYYSFEHAYDWLFALEKSDPKARELLAALKKACGLMDKDFAANLGKASEVIEKVLRAPAERPPLKISAIGHAHMDLAWLWPIRETKRKLARTFSTVLNLQERFPWYVYGASQPQAYQWMKEEYPGLYSRIKAAVKKGKIDPLGAMWVEPDCNMVSGESFIRQILCGREFFKKEFGTAPDYFWIPDSFGYSPQLPQILAKSGVKNFITQKISWNMINKFPHHSFWWEGIDGSRVLAHMLPEDTYNSPAAPRSIIKVRNSYAQKGASRNALIAFGIGDGGGGPGEEHLRRILKNREVPALNEIKNRRVCEFLKDLRAEAENFPLWRGDLYLEKHQGTFTTQGKNKKHNRLCENLLRKAEWLGYVCGRLQKKPRDLSCLGAVWKEVLLYQFHDILPGSSIERVYRESCARYAVLEKFLREFIAKMEREIAEFYGEGVAINCNSWRANFSLGGRALSAAPLGATPLALAKKSKSASAKKFVLENEKIAVRFDKKARMVSMVEKSTGREFLDASRPANVFMVYDDLGDAWDFGYGYRQNRHRPMKCEAAKFYERAGRAIAEFNFSFEKSVLAERVILDGESGEVKIEISLNWQSKRKMLRLIMPLGFAARKSVSEVAFGSYEREANDATKWRRARIETPAHQWVAMKGQGRFFALLNDAKYGYRLKENSIEAGLLRCVPRPGEPLVFAADKSKNPSGDDVDFADIGRQDFKFIAIARSGDFEEHKVAAIARELNLPTTKTACGKPCKHKRLEGEVSFVEISNPNIELAAMKPAKARGAWVMRLVNLSGKPQNSGVKLKFAPRRICPCSLIEEPIKSSEKIGALAFAPHEIKSFILYYGDAGGRG